MNTYDYTKVSNEMLENPKLTVISAVMYNKLCYRMLLSLSNGNAFYNDKGHFYYVVYSLKEFMSSLGSKIGKVRSAMKLLEKYGYVIRYRKVRYIQVRLPKFKLHNVQTSKNKSSNHQKITSFINNQELITNNKHSNTVNTKQPRNSKLNFVEMDRYTNWMDSTEHKMGLTKEAVYQVAKFASTYNLSARKLANYIKEARNTVAKKNHLYGNIIKFECNQNIINNLGQKLSKLFTDIVSKYYSKANLNNYVGFFINSLKHFFKWCFGLNKSIKAVKPKTNTNNVTDNDDENSMKYTIFKDNHGHVIRKIKNPDYLIDPKPQKLHPTNPKLLAKCNRELARMKARDKKYFGK